VIDVRQTLDALVAGKSGNANVAIERLQDDAFEVTIVIGNAILKSPLLDLEQARGAMKWTRDRGMPMRVWFHRWPGWQMLGMEARAKEVLRVCDAKPTRVVVWYSEPATERGEEPMGQPSIVLEAELVDGTGVEQAIADAYTSRSDHERVIADFSKRAKALAETLGVESKVLR
jgi:hypothetical protein